MHMNENLAPMVLITSNQDLLDSYPNKFEKHVIETSDIFVEVKIPQIDYAKENRIILVPSGIVSINTEDSDFLWGNCEGSEYVELLKELNKHCRDGNIAQENSNLDLLFSEEKIGDRDYQIRFFPYNNKEASTNLITEIEEKNTRLQIVY